MCVNNEQRTLGQLIDLQRGNTYKSALLDQAGPVLLGLASIQRNGGFRTDALRTYGGDSDPRILLQPGDLYVSLKDVTQSADLLGAVARVPDTISQGRLTQDTVKLVFRIRDERQSRFIYWLLRTPQYREYCRAHSTGTTNLGLPREDFLAFSVPPLTKAHEALVATLEHLESKIELNRKMSATLEAMARALFKSWFVDFDPVRAKAQGRDPGLPPDIAALFPDSFEDSELGEIPKGWQLRGLDEIARFLNGLALQKHPALNGRALPVIKIAQLRAGNVAGADEASADLEPDYVVSDGDVLFSWSGSLECVLWTGGPGALNQHLFKVTSAAFPKWFFYLWIHRHLNYFRHIAAGKATTMGHIQRHHLSDAKAAIPETKTLEVADCVLSPLIDRIISARLESRTLARIRDLLLPKLISGDIRVTDAERLVEQAV